VQATDITVDNPRWYTFFAGLAGSSNAFAVGAFNAQGDNPGDPPWTYTAATDTIVKITDSFTVGDIFRLYDNGVAIGDMSTIANNGIGTNNATPDLDFIDPLLSHGSFTLSGGNYSLTIEIIQNALPPNDSAIGYFRVDPVLTAPVPEPMSLLLLGTGLGALALAARRKRK
jgi:PEP-CTERM motif